jgi:hypothetical protein
MFVITDVNGYIVSVTDDETVQDQFPNTDIWSVEEDDGAAVGLYRLTDGSYSTVNLNNEKHTKRMDVERCLNEHFQLGFSPQEGPLFGHTLQCRDTEDRTNWLTSQTSYMAAVQMGYGAAPGASFRTMNNETITISFADGLAVLTNGMAVWGKNLMAHSWALKDQIDAASSFEELDAIDIETGWPTA